MHFFSGCLGNSLFSFSEFGASSSPEGLRSEEGQSFIPPNRNFLEWPKMNGSVGDRRYSFATYR